MISLIAVAALSQCYTQARAFTYAAPAYYQQKFAVAYAPVQAAVAYAPVDYSGLVGSYLRKEAEYQAQADLKAEIRELRSLLEQRQVAPPPPPQFQYQAPPAPAKATPQGYQGYQSFASPQYPPTPDPAYGATPPPPAPFAPEASFGQAEWAGGSHTAEGVLRDRCMNCHSDATADAKGGGLAFLDDRGRARLDRDLVRSIQAEVQAGRMPKGPRKLTPSEYQALASGLAAL
jgi:hypothetical protein